MSYIVQYFCTTWCLKVIWYSFGLFYFLMTPALLPLCRYHTWCICNSSHPARGMAKVLNMMSSWAACLLLANHPNHLLLRSGNLCSLHDIPASTATYGEVAKPPCNAKPPSLTRFHERCKSWTRQKGSFSSYSIRSTPQVLNTGLKILRGN